MKQRTRHIRCLVDQAQIRTATFNAVEHLVLPVVALKGDIVVRPLNSTGPEFVPVEVLAVAPGGWAGRPVVPTHPESGTASANEPETLEAEAFGVLFNPRVENGDLKVEAWVDPVKAALVGGDALRVCEMAQKALDGEDVDPIEVSVGAWVSMEERSGVAPSGEAYSFRWGAIVPDHLAAGLDGSPGACSVEMGCGTPRLNQGAPTIQAPEGSKTTIHQVGNLSITKIEPAQMRIAEEGKPMKQKPNFLQRMIDKFRVHQEDGTSDSQLRNELWSELRNVEPGFEWIEDVFQETGKVVYAVTRDDQFLLFRRSFDLDDSGAVTLNDDAEQVEAVVEFQVVTAQKDDDVKPDAVKGAGCGCSENKPKAAQDNKGDSPMSEKLKKLVDGLIACEASPFAEEDAETLSALGEAKLTALSDQILDEDPTPSEGTETPTDTPAPPTAADDDEDNDEEDDADKVTLSREEYEDIVAAASAHKTNVMRQKAAIVAKLKGAQKVYSEAELKEMSLEQLERTALLVRSQTQEPKDSKFNFAGMGLQDEPEGDADDARPAPKPYDIALAKRKAS